MPFNLTHLTHAFPHSYQTANMKNTNALATAPVLTEARLQQECIMWFNKHYRALSDLLFAIPNGEKRDKVTAARLQAQGVKAGVPDLFLARPGGGTVVHPDFPKLILEAHGLFIEMKNSVGTLSPQQRSYHAQLTAQGYRVEVVRSLEAFQQLITDYLA